MRCSSWVLPVGAFVLLCASVWAEDDPKVKKAKDAIDKRTKQVREQLTSVKLTHVFKDRSFGKALDVVRDAGKLEIVIDPVLNPDDYTAPVEEVRNIPLRAALRLICGDAIHNSVRGEAIFITTAKASGALWSNRLPDPAKPTKAQKKLILTSYQSRMGVKFDKKPVKDAVAFLAKKSKAKIKLDSAEDVKDMTVAVVVKDASLRSLLDLVCGTRLAWMIVDDAILVGLPEPLRQKHEEIKAKEEAKRKAKAEKKRKAEEAKKKAEEAKKKAEEEAKKKAGEKAKKPGEGKKEDPKPAPKKDAVKEAPKKDGAKGK